MLFAPLYDMNRYLLGTERVVGGEKHSPTTSATQGETEIKPKIQKKKRIRRRHMIEGSAFENYLEEKK